MFKEEKKVLQPLITILKSYDDPALSLLNFTYQINYDDLCESWDEGFDDLKIMFLAAVKTLGMSRTNKQLKNHCQEKNLEESFSEFSVCVLKMSFIAAKLYYCWNFNESIESKSYQSVGDVLVSLSGSFGKVMYSQGYLINKYQHQVFDQ